VGADGPDGAGGGGGDDVEAGAGESRIDLAVEPEVPRFISARVSDSPMKITARIAVVRVSRLAVPRPDMKEPIPWELPIPSPPPSERWIRTTPIRAKVTNRWMISNTVLNARNFQTNQVWRISRSPARDDGLLIDRHTETRLTSGAKLISASWTNVSSGMASDDSPCRRARLLPGLSGAGNR
jgi:hypothetical protein